MSVHVMSWVLLRSETTLGSRLVLLGLADYAHDDGTKAFPSVESLAMKARLSTRQTQRCLKQLLADGDIVHTSTSKHGTKVYAVVMRTPTERAADLSAAVEGVLDGAGDNTAGVTSDARFVSQMSPNPSTDPSGDLSASTSERVVRLRVSGKPITDAERDKAMAYIEHFNSVTGKDLRFVTSGGAVSQATRLIVCRMREYPDLSDEKHRTIIDRTIASNWWEGDDAAINVIYGPNIFEANIARKAGERPRGVKAAKVADPADAARAASIRAVRLRMEAEMAAGDDGGSAA